MRRPIADSDRITTHEMTAARWNPRYLAYCVAMGACSVEEMKVRDAAQFPDGVMAGFICWIDEQLTAWRAERGVRADASLSKDDHRDFDCWLADHVIAMTPQPFRVAHIPSPLTASIQ